MNLNLKGKNILVTGGAAGIGAAVVKLLEEEGVKAFVIDKRLAEFQEKTIDVRNPADVRDFIATLPPLDGLVLNAALGPFHDDPIAIFETNVIGTLTVLNECRQKLSNFSSIVFVASIAGYRSERDSKWLDFLNAPASPPFDYRAEIKLISSQETYRLTKWLLIEATKKFAKEFAVKKIRVNCIAPGPTKTEMSKALWADNPPQWQRLIVESPFGVAGEPTDVAPAIVFLLSEQTRMITGSFLHVDGGWFTKNAKYE